MTLRHDGEPTTGGGPGAICAVVLDLATHPVEQWAVIVRGELLPMRFATYGEGSSHLEGLVNPLLGKLQVRAARNGHRAIDADDLDPPRAIAVGAR